ncbi:MAG: single-stranded DNA-binding protein [Proteobacteria bacterium]|nr:single-stranded DNA-binding protein [Pseudomonadota bacterium]
MAGSVNKVTLVGNVGRDPEIRSTQHGGEIANFSVATSDVWRDKATGERREKTEWHRVVVFSPALVNIIKNYVHKGSRVYVEGSLQTRKWSDASGVERNTTEIVLQAYNSTIVLLDSKGSGSGHGSGHQNSEPYGSDNGSSDSAPAYSTDDLNDDIPF